MIIERWTHYRIRTWFHKLQPHIMSDPQNVGSFSFCADKKKQKTKQNWDKENKNCVGLLNTLLIFVFSSFIRRTKETLEHFAQRRDMFSTTTEKIETRQTNENSHRQKKEKWWRNADVDCLMSVKETKYDRFTHKDECNYFKRILIFIL